MKLEVIRDDDPDSQHNLGKFYIDGAYFGETLEDKDRYLESGGGKIQDDTAIPRGIYTATLSMSNRFGRVMPEIHDVPDFTGVRIHGGNTEANTEGCILLGAVRTATGVANCKAINDRLVELMTGEAEITLEIT